MHRYYQIYILFSLCLAFCLQTPTPAEQHQAVQDILKQAPSCHPMYIFTPKQLNSDSGALHAFEIVQDMSAEKIERRWFRPIRKMNMLPVNRCVLRSNRYFGQHLLLLDKLQVQDIINADFLSNEINKNKIDDSHNYHYLRMSSHKYPEADGLQAFVQALEILGKASPEQRTLVSCFFGQHRTSLIVASYKFLQAYAQQPEQACKLAASDEDTVYTEMNVLGDQGILKQNMPADFKEFYDDFAKAVCQEKSAQFLGAES